MNATLHAFVQHLASRCDVPRMTFEEFNSMPTLPDHPVVADSPFPLAYDGMVDAMMRYGDPGFKSDAAEFLFHALRVETSFGGSYPSLNERQSMSLHEYLLNHVNRPVDLSHRNRVIWGPAGGDFYHRLNPRSLALYNCTVHRHSFFHNNEQVNTVQGLMAKYSGINIHTHPPVANHLIAGWKMFFFYPPDPIIQKMLFEHINPQMPTLLTLHTLMRKPWLPQPKVCLVGPGTFMLVAREWWHMTFNLAKTFNVGCTDEVGCKSQNA